LISPCNLGGKRGQIVFNPRATFPLAQALRSPEGAPLGELFSFVSGLYFRGKMRYAQAFGRAPEGLSGALVISPAEGLRFLYERLSVERLRAWAEVDIDEHNPRFTRPLIEHATALDRTLGERTRFVLLGSVATDKYVRPLTNVFGERLLFPPDFIGRGDMSRGALLLKATREGRELSYASVLGAERRGARAPGISARRAASPAPPPALDPPRPALADGPELVLLIGLPGAGKSTFFRLHFADSHVHVSRDAFGERRRPETLQNELLRDALGSGRSVVIDNTNVSVEERARFIDEARLHGVRVVGYRFDVSTRECVSRNDGRSGRARIPKVGILSAAKRLVAPSKEEGFDALYRVRVLPELRFEISPE
jgi:predicted kinase